MFSEEDFISLQDIIPKVMECYAHTPHKEVSKKKESLVVHTELCQKYFIQVMKQKKLSEIFKKFEKEYIGEMSESADSLFEEILMNAVTFHDVGKINPEFQKVKMNEKRKIEIEKCPNINTQHSILSAIIYRDYFGKKINNLENKEERKILEYFTFLNSYIISRHHGNLGDLEEYFKTYKQGGNGYYAEKWLSKWIGQFYEEIIPMGISRKRREKIREYTGEKNREQQIYLYIYVRLLYSLLVAADYYATTEYMTGTKTKEFGNVVDFQQVMKVYEMTELSKTIRAYETRKSDNTLDINVLRTKIFLEAERNLKENLEKNIFYLEAPTGSGKSNTAFNLSFQLLKNNPTLKKIFYIYPFNTLVEQNMEILKKTFGENEDVMNQTAVVNSLNPIKVGNQEVDYTKYQRALLDRQFLNYPIVLSTHVSLFKTFFSCSKGDLFGFHQLANSVIILDEIQSYKINIWGEIIQFLKGFSKLLNIKIIIMSATLPNLDILDIGDSEDTVRLIQDSAKYFENRLFKERVKANYELLNDEEFSEIKLKEHVLSTMRTDKTILIEFIKKNQAVQFYKSIIQEDQDYEILLFTGDDNLIERKKLVNRVKEGKEKIVLIATQVIEAGVDIDMQIGYKDTSKLDSEEQFMGRINRSCKNAETGIVYFFNLTDAKHIYKDDNIRLNSELTIINPEMQSLLEKKQFGEFYNKFLAFMKVENEKRGNMQSVASFFSKDVVNLNFLEIETHMQLIEERTKYTDIFVAHKLENENSEIVYGSKVWEQYKELLADMNMDYAEKMVRLSRIRSKVNYFVYRFYGDLSGDFAEENRIGELYYLENGEDYFINGKFDREKFNLGEPEFI